MSSFGQQSRQVGRYQSWLLERETDKQHFPFVQCNSMGQVQTLDTKSRLVERFINFSMTKIQSAQSKQPKWIRARYVLVHSDGTLCTPDAVKGRVFTCIGSQLICCPNTFITCWLTQASRRVSGSFTYLRAHLGCRIFPSSVVIAHWSDCG